MNRDFKEEALKNIKIRCHSKSMKYDNIDFDLDIIEEALQRLEAIEKLQDELGCPLNVLEEAMQNGIYTNVYNNLCMVSRYKDTLIVSDDYAVYIKDYKKTWWLREDKSE